MTIVHRGRMTVSTSPGVTAAARRALLDEIIDDVVRPNAEAVDQEGRFPGPGIRALADAGLFGLSVPAELGGAGATASEISDVVTALARVCASTAMVYLMHMTALTSVVAFAGPRQRERYLEPILAGKALITEAVSEPASGSQWWSVSSTATRVPGGYHIQARKSFATSAGHADLYVVSTRSPGCDDDRDHALFVVSAGHGGIAHGEWRGLGLAGNSSTWISFDCRVEDDALLFGGGGGEGLRRYNEANQPLYHLCVASAYLGIAQAAYEACTGRIRSRRYAANASSFGTQLSGYPVARRHVGTMAIRLASAAALVRRLAAGIDNGTPFGDLAVLMTATKVFLAESAVDVAREAMMASGGSAYVRGTLPIERHLRDAFAASLMGPNDDFCKEHIGRLELEGTSYHDV
jgi:alkylation response protein AidB-like acyl-CoA dehydrogenase